MTILVYWSELVEGKPRRPLSKEFLDTELTQALTLCAYLRSPCAKSAGTSHITMCSEMSAMVGKHGVDSVVDGRTPDGRKYGWSKAGRAGRMKAADLLKVHTPADQQ